MDWNSIWTGIVSNLFYGLLLLGGGTLIAYLRKKQSSWFVPAFWGLGASALILVCIWAWKGIHSFPERRALITSENVEANIKTWLDEFQVSTKNSPNPSEDFGLVATLMNGDPIAIVRLKDHDRYIVFQTTLTISPEHLAMIDKMDSNQRLQLQQDLTTELARAKCDFGLSDPLKTVTLTARIPITPDLTEDEFLSKLDEMDDAIIIARNTIVVDAKKYSTKEKI
jgi:hypothetical protein